jgi:diketogulonate reductase-like aldo/keto reductase
VQGCGIGRSQSRLQASRLRVDVWSMFHPATPKLFTFQQQTGTKRPFSDLFLFFLKVDAEIGAAIRESGIPRSELFITTKFWPHFAAPENVELCLDLSLKNMGLDYVDLYLAHWPHAEKAISREALEKARANATASKADRGILTQSRNGNDNSSVVDWEHTSGNLAKLAGTVIFIDHFQSRSPDFFSPLGQKGSFVPTWNALKRLVSTGKTRAVGVSNFSIGDLKEILPYADDVPISCNQVEVHPWLPNNELISFMREHDILATCYSPFAGQKSDGKTLINDPAVVKLAEENAVDVGQLLQSWAVQRGTIPLGKSQTECEYSISSVEIVISPFDLEYHGMTLPFIPH